LVKDENMGKRIYSYMMAIGIQMDVDSEKLLTRVQEAYNFFSEICPEEIVEVFLSEKATKDGGSEYTDIFFFSDSYLMYAKDFKSGEDYHMIYKEHILTGWNIKKKNFDMKEARRSSMMSLGLIINGKPMDIYMRAMGKNCGHLQSIFDEIILEDLKGYSTPDEWD